jgi:hypothetical protein
MNPRLGSALSLISDAAHGEAAAVAPVNQGGCLVSRFSAAGF